MTCRGLECIGDDLLNMSNPDHWVADHSQMEKGLALSPVYQPSQGGGIQMKRWLGDVVKQNYTIVG